MAAKLYIMLSCLPLVFLGGCNSASQAAKCVPGAGVECFDPTGSMTVARFEPTATVLGNGKVLITGGFDHRYASIRSAELYDPTTGRFTATGSMTMVRAGHTATLLSNGMVLIAGGRGAGVATNSPDAGAVTDGGAAAGGAGVASAELYDPTAGTFTATGSMTVARAGHKAALLSDGRVLVTGGLGNASAELYDPGAGTFTATSSSMTVERVGHTVTVLPSGMVLVSGGLSNASADLYDPAAGTFMATGSMMEARTGHTATLLSSGKVLIAGGFGGSVASNPTDAGADGGPVAGALGGSLEDFASVELYDPGAGTFTAIGSMAVARAGHTATVLPSGKVLIAGGLNRGYASLGSAEIYDPGAGTFTTAGNMTVPRDGHTATVLGNGKVLVAGGSIDARTDLASAELYQ